MLLHTNICYDSCIDAQPTLYLIMGFHAHKKLEFYMLDDNGLFNTQRVILLSF